MKRALNKFLLAILTLIFILSFIGCKKEEPKENVYKLVGFQCFTNQIGGEITYISYEEMFNFFEEDSDKDVYFDNILNNLGKNLTIRDDYNLNFSGILGENKYKRLGKKTISIDTKSDLPILKSFLIINNLSYIKKMITTVNTTLDNGDDFFIKLDYRIETENITYNENGIKPSLYNNDGVVGTYTLEGFGFYVNGDFDHAKGYVPYEEMFDVYEEGSEKDIQLEYVLKCIGDNIVIEKDYIITFSGSLGSFEYKMDGEKNGWLLNDIYLKLPIYDNFRKTWLNIIKVKDITLKNGDNLHLSLDYKYERFH